MAQPLLDNTNENENENDDTWRDDESQYDSEQSDLCGTGVALAFADPIEDKRYLLRSFMPSKVGGKPAWLNPKTIPNSKRLKCSKCKKTLKFLLQIYAPLKQFDRSYNRTIYVFVCENPKCIGNNGSIRVLRSQLTLSNAFYDENEDDINLDELSKCIESGIEPFPLIPNCVVCGNYGSFKCGHCRNPLITYCSKDHQKIHWYKQHRTFCKKKELESATQIHECLKNYCFKSFEVNPDTEPLPIEMDEIETESKKIMKNYKKSAKKLDADNDYNDDDLKLLEEQMAKDFDDCYLKFEERVSRAPTQIIRYNENMSSDDNDPLWMCKNGIIKDYEKEIPKCNNCGEDRLFEFQIMPQLLSVLKQGVNDLDFGIIAIFSCKNSCGDGSTQYFDEFAFYQQSHGAFEVRGHDGLIG